MDLSQYAESLRRELTSITRFAGEDITRAAEMLSETLDSSVRLALLDVLSAAADEITASLDGATIDVRLSGTEPEFVVNVAHGAEDSYQDAADATDEAGSTRITLRLSESLKTKVEAAAVSGGMSVNAWLVRGDQPCSRRLAGRGQAPAAVPAAAIWPTRQALHRVRPQLAHSLLSDTRTAPQKGTAMTSWDFASSDPVDISIDNWGSGSIVVAGEPTSAVTVEVVPSHRDADVAELLAQVQVSFEDGQLYIHGPRASTFRRKKGLDLTIRAPEGSSCAAKTVSADLSCVGDLSAVSLQTASGDLTAASVGDELTVRSASGDVLLDKVAGTVSIHTASGDVQATQRRRRRPDQQRERRRQDWLVRRPRSRTHRQRRRRARRRRCWPRRAGQRLGRPGGRCAARVRRLHGPRQQLRRYPQRTRRERRRRARRRVRSSTADQLPHPQRRHPDNQGARDSGNRASQLTQQPSARSASST